MSTRPPIPPADPRANYLAHAAEIDAAVRSAFEAGRYVLGPETSAFEREFAAWVGAAHAVGVGSGTEAIQLALRAAEVGPGDEVITVSHTAVGTVAAIELAGAVPVLADIDLASYTLDPAALDRARTPRTRAVVAVHLYGHPAALEAIGAWCRAHGVVFVEDCAQSHGAALHGKKTGTWGDVAAFSFYPTKNLGAIGDGGAVVTSDTALAERARMLREYGWRERYVSERPGLNSRLDEVQAAILRVKLRHLDQDNARRRALAELYLDSLADADVERPSVAPGVTHAFHQFVVRHPRRDALREALQAEGIGTLVHYPVPVHLQPAYAGRVRTVGPLVHTEEAAATVVSLPMYPELATESAARVAHAIRAWTRRVPA